MATQSAPYDRWLWIELTGFDNEAADYGVQAYLDKAAFIPDVISLLLFNPDFVHTHDGEPTDRLLPFDCCSYAGHPRGYERERQGWTQKQLKGLIEELHRYGVAVFFAVFDMFVSDEWIGQHPELWHMSRSGAPVGSVCPWKRLADGNYYQDFFARKLGEVIGDYGFDGFHQADGYSHPRLPVYEGDFSADIVGQFVDSTGVCLPEGLGHGGGDEPETVQKRAEWIWRHARRDWIGFYAERISAFCKKVAGAVHAAGGRVVLNSSLTRDPFQALYRYGVDYRGLAEAGVDGLVVETVAPGVSLGAESGVEANPHYDYLAMLLLIKARVPDLELHCLNNAHDVREQWDVLRHGPALLEREIYCNSNLYLRRGAGLERCSHGPVLCLSDGIQRHEWAWLREWWDRGFTTAPRRLIGATLVWSDSAFERELDEFIATRRPVTHKLVYELMGHGAPVHCVARVEDLTAVDGPLLVINADLFTEGERQAVLAYDRGPVIAIGGPAATTREPNTAFTDGDLADAPSCRVYGTDAMHKATIEPEAAPPAPEDLMAIAEPPTFLRELFFQHVSESFLSECAKVLADCAGAAKTLRRPDVIRVQALELDDGTLRLLIGNDSHYYVVTSIDVGREIDRVSVVTPFPGTPPTFEGTTLGVRAPGKGMVVLDVALKG